MAVVALTPVSLANHKSATLVAPGSWTAANTPDGNSIPNGGSTILGMNNSGASSRTVVVTIPASAATDSQAVTGVTHTLAAGEVKYVKLGNPGVYGNPTLVTASHAEVLLKAFTL